jgi:hypothetical protein
MVGAEQADMPVIAVVESDTAGAERLLGNFWSHAALPLLGVLTSLMVGLSVTRRSRRLKGKARKPGETPWTFGAGRETGARRPGKDAGAASN